MKRLISILVSLALLVASVFAMPVQAETTVDTVSPADELAATFGATEANLVLSEDFSDSSFADRVSYRDEQATDVTQFEVVDGKWYVQTVTNKAVSNKNGWTGRKLGNFVATFEFTPRICGWGQSQFFYHSATGQPGNYTYDIHFKPIEGKQYVIRLIEKSTGNMVDSEYMNLTVDQPYNVVVVSKELVDSVYFWKVGDPIPTKPVVSMTKTARASGDMYYYAYNDKVAIDDIKIYDLSGITPENMRTATGLDLTQPYYVNDFEDNYVAPPAMYNAYKESPFNGTSNVTDGKWVVSGETGFNALTGKNNLGDFAVGYQMKLNDTDANGKLNGWLAYNSYTGWNDKNTSSTRFSYWQTATGTLHFDLSAVGAQTASAAISYTNNETLNLVLTKFGGVVNAYIWKAGEIIPTTPVMSVTTTSTTTGDLYFHTIGSEVVFDNFFAYDLSDTKLYPEHISSATGYELDDDMLVYESDFDTATEAPVNVFNAYLEETFGGINKIENGKWVTGGTIGTSTGLTKHPYLKNFAYGFQFSVSEANSGYYATFAYHSTSGWAGVNPENRMQMWESGGKLVFDLYGNDGSDETSATPQRVTTGYAQGDLVNVVMSYVDGKISAYIWKAGEKVPAAPTLTVDAAVATSGDFYYTLSGAKFAFEDIYVFDLTSDDSDGVYTTMESSYRMESTFKGLPKTIETTIKMPTIFTGGKGNTILGNFEDKDYVFSFEINANGNPYIYFNPPWKQQRVVEFTEVDVRTGEWINLAITTDVVKDEVSCYVNGELKQTVKIPTHYDPVLEQNTDFLDYTLGSELYIGRDMRGAYDKYYFKGKIKTLTMFSDIRTAEEIAADMSGVSASADALIADYCFDGCYGKGVTDNSANSYDLVNVGYMETVPEEPTDYAYSFAVVGDTQILTRVYPEKLSCIYDWIVENKEAHNIQYVMGLGDITDSDTDAEWQVAASAISKLNGVVPYSLVRGNHDSEHKFSTYLTDIYSSQIDGCYNNDINSSYSIFTVGEVDYLLINLNMGAIDAELAWAEELIASHPNHNVIITTHIYLDSDGTRIDDYGTVPATTCRENANNGDDIWNELISKYSNISLVMSGHVSSTEVLVKKSEGANGNIVTEMLIDPQSTDESYSAGPAGLVTMLYFSEDGKTVQVRNYSTVRDEYFGAQNQFTMEVETVDYLYGDVNDDAKVDVLDLVRLKKAVAEMDVKYNVRTSNINKDEKIDALDITELRKELNSTVA